MARTGARTCERGPNGAWDARNEARELVGDRTHQRPCHDAGGQHGAGAVVESAVEGGTSSGARQARSAVTRTMAGLTCEQLAVGGS